MSSRDDDNDLQFDFFDEPETVEATQRRRLPRLEMPGGRGGGGGERPPRQPLRAPTGLVPLARLVGLIAIAIAVVIGLVFWIGSCQGKSKHDEYQSYAEMVAAVAKADNGLGTDFANEFLSTNLKQSELVEKLQGYAQREQQTYTQAQQIRAPGPLRAVHSNLVDAIQLRAQGLQGLADTLAAIGSAKSLNQSQQTDAVAELTKKGELLTASDVVWDQLYQSPATQQLQDHGVKGVVIPSSKFVSNPDIVSARSFQILITTRLAGASTGGTPSGKHGDGLVSVRVTPQGTDLSAANATTVKVSADLAFVATVEDSGDFQEVNVPVRLTIDFGSGKPIRRVEKIQLIQPTQQQTVTFTNFELPTAAFGNPAKVKIEVAPVAGEINTSNNTATYTVYFTLS
jgi:hypothetical protein